MPYTVQEIREKLKEETELKYHPWIVVEIATEHEQQGIALDFDQLAKMVHVTPYCERIEVTITDNHMSVGYYPVAGDWDHHTAWICGCKRKACKAHLFSSDLDTREKYDAVQNALL